MYKRKLAKQGLKLKSIMTRNYKKFLYKFETAREEKNILTYKNESHINNVAQTTKKIKNLTPNQ